MSFWNELIRFDRNVNADVFDGSRKETMSARMGRKLEEGNLGCCKWRVWVCKVLSWIDPRKGNHCIEAIEIEVKKD